jgi:peptidoglycan hydrolase CwlO-like protein
MITPEDVDKEIESLTEDLAATLKEINEAKYLISTLEGRQEKLKAKIEHRKKFYAELTTE